MTPPRRGGADFRTSAPSAPSCSAEPPVVRRRIRSKTPEELAAAVARPSLTTRAHFDTTAEIVRVDRRVRSKTPPAQLRVLPARCCSSPAVLDRTPQRSPHGSRPSNIGSSAEKRRHSLSRRSGWQMTETRTCTSESITVRCSPRRESLSSDDSPKVSTKRLDRCATDMVMAQRTESHHRTRSACESASPGVALTPVQRRRRRRSKSPCAELCREAQTPLGDEARTAHPAEERRSSLAMQILKTVDWEGLCRDRGLETTGSKRHLAQQLRHSRCPTPPRCSDDQKMHAMHQGGGSPPTKRKRRSVSPAPVRQIECMSTPPEERRESGPTLLQSSHRRPFIADPSIEDRSVAKRGAPHVPETWEVPDDPSPPAKPCSRINEEALGSPRCEVGIHAQASIVLPAIGTVIASLDNKSNLKVAAGSSQAFWARAASQWQKHAAASHSPGH